ncbi:MAG: alkaline phosphatase family protein, partial [Longimicrobiales bacterium]
MKTGSWPTLPGRSAPLLSALLSLPLLTCTPSAPMEGPGQDPEPRLILQITVDQLRGDLPLRHYDRFGEGGFRYLVEQGTVYRDAHHAHANTETVVGHVTLATGAHPSAHGMVGNLWFDRDAGRTVYNIEDTDYRLLTAGGGVDQATEIDPTQRAARSDGRSPAAIMVSTFSDELAIGTAGTAKIFGVSVKDRGAVSMAGHSGKAFWFSKQSGEFVTSTYYYDEYPDWVVEWNAKRMPFAYAGAKWSLLHPADTYMFG